VTEALGRLTARQRECLRRVGQGFTSKEIGRQLGISYATVDNHIRASLEVLQVDGRAEAARLLLAAEAGQPLTSQPSELAEAPLIPAFPIRSERPRRWWERLAPPLGGELHDLSWERRVFEILRVAFVGFVGLILLTLGTIILLWLLR
jgi:DNA-binding CsgD family transcriptional regulator